MTSPNQLGIGRFTTGPVNRGYFRGGICLFHYYELRFNLARPRSTRRMFTHLSLDLTDEPCGEILANRLEGSRLQLWFPNVCVYRLVLPQTCSGHCTQNPEEAISDVLLRWNLCVFPVKSGSTGGLGLGGLQGTHEKVSWSLPSNLIILSLLHHRCPSLTGPLPVSKCYYSRLWFKLARNVNSDEKIPLPSKHVTVRHGGENWWNASLGMFILL